jgi:hypothetical protein
MSKQTNPQSTKKRSKQRDSNRGTCKSKNKKEAKHRRQNFIGKKYRDLYAQQHGILLQKQRIDAAFQSSPIEVRKRKERSKKRIEARKLKERSKKRIETHKRKERSKKRIEARKLKKKSG